MRNLLKIKLTLISFIALLIAFQPLKTEVPQRPMDFSSFYNCESAELYHSWMLDRNSNIPEGFKVYLAKGMKNDYNDFEMIFDYKIGDRDSLKDMFYFFAAQKLVLELGDYSLYTTAYNQDGESDPSYITYMKVCDKQDTIYKYIEFTSIPVEKALIGEQYYYDADAKTNNPDDVIKYSLIEKPDGMQINEETGEVTWTPQESGRFLVGIMAFVDNMTNNMQYYMIYVPKCSQPPTISGTVLDKNGEPMKTGYIYFMTPNDSLNYVPYTTVEDGKYSVEVDEGTYFLGYYGYIPIDDDKNFLTYYEWYENAQTIDDATPIEVKCGDNLVINMNLNGPPDINNYNVSGSVKSKDGKGLSGMLVQFESIYDDTPDKRNYASFSTITDKEGNYTIKLPDIFRYIAFAYDPTCRQYRAPIYYDQTYDPMEAEVIELTADRDNINFIFDEAPWDPQEKYFSINGIVENKDGEIIENPIVIAFLTDDNSGMNNTTVATFGNDMGEFSFKQLNPGNYILFAIPQSSEYAPGFYKEGDIAVLTWEKATNIFLDKNSIDDIHIKLPKFDEISGTCEYGGVVSSKKISIIPDDKGEPISGASLYLVNPNGSIVKYGKTDSQGNFLMKNLEEGIYTFVVDKVGYKNYQTTVVIKENQNVYDNAVEMLPEGTSSVKDSKKVPNATIYPNPASGVVDIIFEDNNNNSSINVYNSAGKIVSKLDSKTSIGQNIIHFDTNTLSNGMYFFRIETTQGRSIIPVVVSH